MKISYIIFFILLLNFNSKAQWSLIWSDEFNSLTIDTTNWNFETENNGWGNNELQYYTNHLDNVCISNDNLLIIARQESYGGSNYTSARINTKGKHNWTYGKIEAKIKLSKSQGIWPAFWMLGESFPQVVWPLCGELDIMEHINNDTVTYGTLHWDANGHAEYGTNTTCNVMQYHVYSIEWDKDTIKWLLDNKLYHKVLIADSINSTEEFHKPFYILLNMTVGGNWPGNPDNTTVFPDTMYIDYVRVYQKTNSIKDGLNQNNIFDIYPNPFNTKINFKYAISDNDYVKLKVYDISGNEVSSFYGNNKVSGYGELALDTSDLKEGIYLCQLKTKETVSAKKIVLIK